MLHFKRDRPSVHILFSYCVWNGSMSLLLTFITSKRHQMRRGWVCLSSAKAVLQRRIGNFVAPTASSSLPTKPSVCEQTDGPGNSRQAKHGHAHRHGPKKPHKDERGEDELLPNYFDRIHSATGGLSVTTSHSDESARSLVAQGLQLANEAPVPGSPSTSDLHHKPFHLVAVRLFNDYRLGGPVRARELMKEKQQRATSVRTDRSRISKLSLRSTPSQELIEDPFASFVRF
jgi:hypothetical protein